MMTSNSPTATPSLELAVSAKPPPIVLDLSTAKRRPLLKEDEARMLTTEIQRASVRVWLLVTEAHDRAAHFALGYPSWDDYVRAEFQMSPSRSYQLLDTGHVMRAIAEAGADIDHMNPPPARVVTRVKGRLAEVRKASRKAVRAGEDPVQALREIARAPRVPEPRSSDETPPEQPRVALITCPACEGDGKVTRGLANQLRPFLKKLLAKR